jgi:hypothetical protein
MKDDDRRRNQGRQHERGRVVDRKRIRRLQLDFDLAALLELRAWKTRGIEDPFAVDGGAALVARLSSRAMTVSTLLSVLLICIW